MSPKFAVKLILVRGQPLNQLRPTTSIVSIFDLSDDLGGSIWIEFCFMSAFIYLGFRKQIICYSEGWYCLPPSKSVEENRA
ncbi:hypothetical protein [Phaeobacter inhibens]|uniref:hypothetical protein n=1 Tax=Phaeobacter inhibens TaxID=221822 RepID=UPI0021A77410|nr:hypothetical protein [Phaeobacter inhibens]UWR74054.1 hypothetical protein K4L00_08110 [Phaeobacter inhibens]